jgi:hypothetical protein
MTDLPDTPDTPAPGDTMAAAARALDGFRDAIAESKLLSLAGHPSQVAANAVNRYGVPHPAAWESWNTNERFLWNLGVAHAMRHRDATPTTGRHAAREA